MHVFAAIIFLSFSAVSLALSPSVYPSLSSKKQCCCCCALYIMDMESHPFVSVTPWRAHLSSPSISSLFLVAWDNAGRSTCVCWHNTKMERKREGENTAGMWKTAAEQDQTSRTDAPHVPRVRQKQYQVLMGMAINRFSSSPFHWHVEEEHAAHDGARRNDAC